MPADEIDDEDERCRVRHAAFVRRQVHKRPSDFWFIMCWTVIAIVIIGTLYLAFTHY